MILEKLEDDDLLKELLNKGVLELKQWEYAQGGCLLAIKDDFGFLVGMIACSDDVIYDKAIAIDDFEITRNNRNNHLGEYAYYKFENKAKEMGYRKITLAANEYNAQRFWTKLGFSTELGWEDGGIYMFKDL